MALTKVTESAKRKRRVSLLEQLKVAKKYCFDDLEFDEFDETDIPGKCMSLIKKIVEEGASISKLEAITYCVKKLKTTNLLKSLPFDEVFNLITKLNENIKNHNIHDDVTAHSVYVSLLVYSNEDMPTALYVEDYINDILSYFKNQLEELVIYFSKKSSNIKKRSNSVPAFTNFLIKNLTQLEEFIRIRNFSSNNFLFLLISCVKIIFHVFVYDLQMAVIHILKSAFEKREEFTRFILNEIFGAIKRLPENYKFVKNFVAGEFSNISMFTVLILNLIQGIGNNLQGKKINEGILKETYEDMFKICGLFAVTFVNKCASDVEHYKSYRLVLEYFMGELMEISDEPEWPAGKIILQVIAKPLTELAKGNVSNDVLMRVFSIKLINRIAVGLIKAMKEFNGKAEEILKEFEGMEEFNSLEIAQILLILSLTNENCKFVYQVEWFENVRRGENYEEKKDFVLNLFQRANLINKKVSEEEARALAYYVDTKRFNYADFHIFLNYILHACYDQNKKVKGVGAQCLAELINLDENLLSKNTVSKTMSECLSASSAVGREAICRLLGKFLANNLEKAKEYSGYFLRLLNDESVIVRKACIAAVQNLISKDVPHAKEMCYKILTMIQDEDLSVQKEAIGFGEKILLEETNADLLLEIVEIPNALKYLRALLEGKLKPKIAKVTEETQTQPETEATETTEKLVEIFLGKMKEEGKKLSTLKMFSVIGTVYPKVLTKYVGKLAEPLNEAKYSQDFAVEILTAETINYILPEMVAPDVLVLIMLIDKLIDKLTGSESLSYSTGFLVSVLKLLKNLSQFGDENFMRERLFDPNLEVLKEYLISGKCENEKALNRAICVTIYLHVELEPDFGPILEKLLDDPKFCLTALHAVCYLSMEHKLIMRNEKLQETISKYLKCKKKYVLTQAVLHNILSCLKNANAGDSEIISEVIQKYSDDILECVVAPNFEIRHTSCMLVSYILKSGLSIDSKFVPYVVTMSADPIPAINKIGADLLKHTSKRWDFSRSPQKGMIMSQKVLLKVSGREHARGYREQNGRLESRCNLLYVLHREDETKRRRLTESILNELKPESSTTATEKLYLVDHLAFFTYKYQDEILYLLRQIDHVKSVVSVPEEPEKEDFVRRYYGLYLLTPLKKYLQMSYGINDSKITKYYGVEGKKDLITKRGADSDCFVKEGALPQNLKFEDVYDALKMTDITDSSSVSSLEDVPLVKSVLKDKLVNERFTKSEQRPKKKLSEDNLKFYSAKKVKIGKNSSKVAKSLF